MCVCVLWEHVDYVHRITRISVERKITNDNRYSSDLGRKEERKEGREEGRKRGRKEGRKEGCM